MADFALLESQKMISRKTQCGNCGNSLSRFFSKNFVKVTFLLKKLLELFDEIFCETKSYIFPLCAVGEFTLTIFRWRFHEKSVVRVHFLFLHNIGSSQCGNLWIIPPVKILQNLEKFPSKWLTKWNCYKIAFWKLQLLQISRGIA